MKKYIFSIITLCFGMFAHADNISVPDVNSVSGGTTTIGISLDNTETNLVSFQMDLTLPEGITINKAGCSLSSRFTDDDQELTIGKLDGNVYRLTSTSFALIPISGTSGEIITLSLTASAHSEGGTATLSNIRFVTSQSERIMVDDASFNITVTKVFPRPVPQNTFEVNTPYYLYNVGRGMFANKGEAWGTQSTLGHQGMKYEVRHDNDMPEGYYYLYSDETGRNNKVMFRTNGDGRAGVGVCVAFVDNNKGDNAYWTIQPFNDNVTGGFIIQIPEDTKGSCPFVATQAWGAQWDHWGNFFDSNSITNGIFFDVEIAANPDNVTWQFVSEDDYATYQDALDTETIDLHNAANDLKGWIDLAKLRGADVAAAEELYNNTACSSADLRAALADLKPYVDAQKAAVKLQAAIDQAGEYGVDVAEAQEVLNNPEATATEINAATDKLNGEIKVAKASIVLATATSSAPVDLFAEAIFENATFTNNISGWTSTTSVQNKAHKSPNVSDMVTCGVDGKNAEGNFYENWDPNASRAVGKMYQKQAELPAGLYVGKLSVFVSTLSQNNTGDAPEQFAYLNNVKEPLTQSKFKSYTMILQQAEKGDIEMGFEQTAAVANWLGIDNASLKYYGDGSDNYSGLAADLIGADWEAEFLNEDSQWPIHTPSVRNAVNNAIDEGATASTPDAGIVAAESALAALDGLRTNISLWKELNQTVYGNGSDIIGMYDLQYNLEIDGWENESAFRALLDELAEKLDEIMDDPSKATWDNAELQEKLNQLNNLYDEALNYQASNVLDVGDVNKDGTVSIPDVTALVNIILGKDNAEPYQYDHDAADVNGDGSITIPDVTALVNIILGK